MKRLILAVFIATLPAFCIADISQAEHDQMDARSAVIALAGRWEGSLSISTDFSQSFVMDLEQTGARVQGTINFFGGDEESSGKIRGTIRKKTMKFTLLLNSKKCPGSFNGTASIADGGDSMYFTLKGRDCEGRQKGEGSALLFE